MSVAENGISPDIAYLAALMLERVERFNRKHNGGPRWDDEQAGLSALEDALRFLVHESDGVPRAAVVAAAMMG